MNKPGETDSSFHAHCPKCGGREWAFYIDDDARICTTQSSATVCGYIHWLRGPNKNAPVPLENLRQVEPGKSRKDRVRELVHLLAVNWKGNTPEGLAQFALELDKQIERINE